MAQTLHKKRTVRNLIIVTGLARPAEHCSEPAAGLVVISSSQRKNVMPLFRHILFVAIISLSGLTACAGDRVARSADVPETVTPVPSSVSVSLNPTPSATPSPLPPTATPSPMPTPTLSLAEVLLAEARHSQGAADAPVTFIEFSDFK